MKCFVEKETFWLEHYEMQEIYTDPSPNTSKECHWLLCAQWFYLSITIYTWFDHKVLTSIVYPVHHHNYSTEWSPLCLWGGARGFLPVRRSYRIPVVVWILFSIIQRKKAGWEDEISLPTLPVTKTSLGCCKIFKMLQYLQEIAFWVKTTWLKFHPVRIAKLPEWTCQPFCSYVKHMSCSFGLIN